MKNKEIVLTILREARKLLKSGWRQYTPRTIQDGHDKYCMAGALYHASSQIRMANKDIHGIYESAFLHISDEIGGGSIVEWNDTTGRTQEEVISVLDNTIKTIKSKEA